MPSIIADSRVIFLLRRTLRQILQQIPTDCPLCEGRARGGCLCLGCFDDITKSMHFLPARCARCALRGGFEEGSCSTCTGIDPVFTRVIAAFDYEAPFDSLVRRYKAEHRFGLSTAIAQVMADALRRATWPAPTLSSTTTSPYGLGTILVPIPSSRASLRQRGFNPAAELAASLGILLQIPVRRSLLRRVREGSRQAMNDRSARLASVEGLFVCAETVKGVAVGLVDDVMTTGSTVNAAANALLRAGASDVTVLVAARTPWRDYAHSW